MEKLYYWKSKSEAEVDYIFTIENKIYPLEVKSGVSGNLKSIRVYAEKFKPPVIIRASMRNFTHTGDFINIPLYAVSELTRLIESIFGG